MCTNVCGESFVWARIFEVPMPLYNGRLIGGSQQRGVPFSALA